jgi:phospholipid-binding lipoprotein MlaA
VTPTFVRTGVTNFFSNLEDVIIIANDLLQAKFREGLANTARVVINTTAGIGGLVDIGTRFGLPKGNEDLGQTLGVWGVQPGPYFVLPLFGPSTIRDGFGRLGDTYFQYWRYVDHVPTRNSVYALEVLNNRANLLAAGNILSGAALDEYSFVRDAYLQRRERLVHDGNVVTPKDEFEDEEPEESGDKAKDAAPKPAPKAPPEQKEEVPDEITGYHQAQPLRCPPSRFGISPYRGFTK